VKVESIKLKGKVGSIKVESVRLKGYHLIRLGFYVGFDSLNKVDCVSSSLVIKHLQHLSCNI